MKAKTKWHLKTVVEISEFGNSKCWFWREKKQESKKENIVRNGYGIIMELIAETQRTYVSREIEMLKNQEE